MAQRAGILTLQERRMDNKSSDGEHVVTIDGSLGMALVDGQWCSWIIVALRGLCAPATIHTDSMGILNGLHRGEKMCIAPRAEEADLWIGLWEGVEEVRDRDIRLDVMHVKAHRTQKKKQR